MLTNSNVLEIERKVLAVMTRVLLNVSKTDKTQLVINLIAENTRVRRVDISRYLHSMCVNSTILASELQSAGASSYQNTRVSIITRAICKQNADKSYSLMTHDELQAKYAVQRTIVRDLAIRDANYLENYIARVNQRADFSQFETLVSDARAVVRLREFAASLATN